MLFYLTMYLSSRLNFNKSTTDEQLNWLEIIHTSKTCFHFCEKKNRAICPSLYYTETMENRSLEKVLLKLCLRYDILEMDTNHQSVRKL